ncbi:hypothetical protein BHU72_15070 [Desulfuribacillus stibiiarsenatis]|uniref:Uncharacterized protein n=1 Tax=Desulfuribacillus stibiiarsenatis TaxID=1390249 RepID=A0A1E5L615_9FIRM|nr:hypothetical protein [Desulfuribacillus stibiiarsenatis]OEH85561.1 hypothetical protein BHU72_15070 [Desulfuribacillus stibiiarsenatis]
MIYNLLHFFFKKLFASTASFASLIGLAVTLRTVGQTFTTFQQLLISGAIIFFLINIYLEYKDSPKIYRKEKDINEYMYSWISRGGRVAIFTRDMTWAKQENIKALLFNKAANNELAIYLPEVTPKISSFLDELESLGAELYQYPELDLVPESRFTIINKDRNDARVAVGRTVNGKHVIEEYDMGGHPVFFLANDITKAIYKHNKLMRGKENAEDAAS